MTSAFKKTHLIEHQQVEKKADALSQTIDLLKDIPRFDNGDFHQYRHYLTKLPEALDTGQLKIAVTGVIKSGKSTLINSILGKEVVKRGAGVMTAITTRIRKGKRYNARLSFKSWDQINTELGDAMAFFPSDQDKQIAGGAFDIRRSKDRQLLMQIQTELEKKMPTADLRTRPEWMLIQYALNGYETCKDFVGADEHQHQFTGKQFDDHKMFTANQDHAYYVKDVCLDLWGSALSSNLEIADCQGADSTDPAQLGRVLDYLSSADLILYCISSRTGLRQSDITLLRRLEAIGRLDQVLFIVNCDLSEHEDLADLKRVGKGVITDLGRLNIQNPDIYFFSALLNLFGHLKHLSAKDKARMEFWLSDNVISQYSRDQYQKFEQNFENLIKTRSFELLLSSHLNQMNMICRQLIERSETFTNLLSSDHQKEAQAKQQLLIEYENFSKYASLFETAFPRVTEELKTRVGSDLADYFNTNGRKLYQDIISFIDTIQLDVDQYRKMKGDSGFQHIFYLIFQDFKQQLALFTIEQLQPEIGKFIDKEEHRLVTYFNELFDSFHMTFKTGAQGAVIKRPKNAQRVSANRQFEGIDLDEMKDLIGLSVPNPVISATYSPSIKANLFSGFFFKTLVEIVMNAVRKKRGFSFSPVLEKTALTIKTENKKSTKKQLHEFQHRLENEYFLPLVEAGLRAFEKKIRQKRQQIDSQKLEINNQFDLDEAEKQRQRNTILNCREHIEKIQQQLQGLMALFSRQGNGA